MSMLDIESAQFRQLLGRFATGVAIVTVADADGTPHGMTINSLTAVSLAPPLLLACIDHAASIRPRLLATPTFAVNILEQHQETISRRFAGDQDERFDGVGYQSGRLGHPLLDGALAHIECERFSAVETGDHTIVIGRVVAGMTYDGRPLCYYRGGYAALG